MPQTLNEYQQSQPKPRNGRVVAKFAAAFLRPKQFMIYLNYCGLHFRKTKKRVKDIDNCTKYNENPVIYYMITKGK